MKNGMTRKYLDLAKVMFVALNERGEVTLVNRRGSEILEYEEEEIIGKNWFDIFLPDNIRNQTRNVFDMLISGKIEPVENYENPVVTKSGEKRIISWHNTIVRNDEGKITGTLSSGEDITDRKRAEEALKRSESLLKRTEHLSMVGGWEYDVLEGKMIWTDEVYRIYGVNKEDYDPNNLKHDIDFCTPEDREAVERAFKNAVEKGESYDLEFHFISAKGEQIWARTIGDPVFKNGKIIKVVGNIMDITELKQAESALIQSESKYRALFECKNEAVFVHPFQKEGFANFIEVNEVACKQLEYTREELLCMSPGDISAPEDVRSQGSWKGRERLMGDKRLVFEAVHITKSGKRIPVEISSSVFDLEGKSVIISSARDITARKQAEAERERLEEQFRQSQKMEAVGRLAGGISHDFNNLLSPILGYGEMLLGDLVTDDNRREFVNGILNAGLRARDLVRQMMAFSRKQTLEYKPVDINEAVTNFEKLLRRTIRENIDIEIVKATDIQPVMADIGQIEQVILNLAVNAADAMPKGGYLTIETARVELDENCEAIHQSVEPGQYIMLSVSDTGCGMDRETFEHLFEPFFSTKGKEGTGLGLSTVYGIVKQHGGYIWIESEPSRGSTFKIYLPVASESPTKEDIVEKTITGPRGSETILLVEDDEQVRNISNAILKRQGYRVLVAENGKMALTIVDQLDEPVHLLLTDVIMPEMNGKELFKKIAEKDPGVKVLFMSGYADNVITEGSLLDEGIALIKKPFTASILASKVREVLEQGLIRA